MCWYSTNPQEAIVHTANTNISVFKVCYLRNGVITSVFQGFIYELNKPYHEPRFELSISKEPPFTCSVWQGFHSYSPFKTKVIKDKDNTVKIKSNVIITDLGSIYTKQKLIKVNGYIPEGSFYCENAAGELVSNNIILTGYEEI